MGGIPPFLRNTVMCTINLTSAQKAKLTKANRLISSVMEEAGVQYLSSSPLY